MLYFHEVIELNKSKNIKENVSLYQLLPSLKSCLSGATNYIFPPIGSLVFFLFNKLI